MSDAILTNILTQINEIKLRLARVEKMEFGTSASLKAAGFALTSDIPEYPMFAESTVTQGFTGTSLYSGTTSQIDMLFWLLRPIKLASVLWICRIGSYTLSLLDYENNLIATLGSGSATANAQDVAFDGMNTVIGAGRWKLRLTSTSGNVAVYYNSDGNVYEKSNLYIPTAGILASGIATAADKAPARLVFHDSI